MPNHPTGEVFSEAREQQKNGNGALWATIAGVGGTVAGLAISAGVLLTMPSVIASSGLIGAFELSLGSGETSATLRFNPSRASMKDLIQKGLNDEETAPFLASTIITAVNKIDPDSVGASKFLEFLSLNRGPFDPGRHWFRDITSKDGLTDLVQIGTRLNRKNPEPKPTQNFKEIKVFLLAQVEKGEGIFRTGGLTARFTFSDTLTATEAAVCDGSPFTGKALMVTTGRLYAGEPQVVVANKAIRETARCEIWKKRDEKQQWVQLSRKQKLKLFGPHGLSVETGYIDVLDKSDKNALKRYQ